jgi:EmrB/QacA subfamily drug resistance transporter
MSRGKADDEAGRETDRASAASMEGVVPDMGEPRREGFAASRAIPLTVGACFFMEGLDATIIATSLPQIAEAMNVTPHETGIALTAYLISVSVWMAASGWLADRFEVRRIFVASIVIFTLGSLVCGLSNNMIQLVAGRFLQGMGGALMTPVGRLILARSFSRGQLVRAMSYMIVPGLLGPMLGPVVGGTITTYLDWRWIFFINLPLGAFAVCLAMRFLARIPATAVARFDGRGFVIVAVALVALQASLETAAARSSFGTLTQLGLAIGLVACLVYGCHARRRDPILDLRMFRYRTFAVAVLGGSVTRIVLGATLFLFPLYFQLGLGTSAIEAGYLMGVLAVGQIALRLGIDPLLNRLGIRKLLVANCVGMGLLLAALLAFEEGDSLLLLGGFLFLFGMLQAIHLSTLAGLNFSGIPAEVLGQATSIAAVVQRLAMALGISCAAILLGYASGEGETVRTSFVAPTLVLSAILLLSAGSFLTLRRGDGDDLLGRA